MYMKDKRAGDEGSFRGSPIFVLSSAVPAFFRVSPFSISAPPPSNPLSKDKQFYRSRDTCN